MMDSELKIFTDHIATISTYCDNDTPSSPENLAVGNTPAYRNGLKVVTGEDLLQMTIPARKTILSPWLQSQGLAMIFAARGIGKTWVGLNIAHAVGGGASFLRWTASEQKTVCYIDGEMPAVVLKERYASIVEASGYKVPETRFRLIAADLQPNGLPDLADPAEQLFYDKAISGADLIIVDNLSTICRSVRENEADSWGPVQNWCLRQRALGRSVILIHHGGKSGHQRGTSRKEDILDTVIQLKRPPNYDPSEGARFEVHYTKSRGFFGDDAAPYEARLTDSGWLTSEIIRSNDDVALRSLQAEGRSVREIATLTGIPKSTVGRRLTGGTP